ncbi:MAG: biotin/lipoate protein ligase [Anaerospora sp.]|nr:biotin/lipoate protein ligase [Anaerospora sp.]
MGIDGKWRVIFDKARHGAANMAIDEAIVEAHSAGLVPPTLRFYTWQPAALSIGYFQKIREEVQLEACRSQGIDLVRRITGGRAVLHDQELTYSAVVREDIPVLPPTLLGSYRYLSQGLLAGLNKQGVAAEMTLPGAAFGQSSRLPKNGACFDAPSFYEITVDRKKLIGSAQVRKNGTLLQHGSILDSTVLAQTIADEFGRTLMLEMVPDRLTAWEIERAAELEREKFAADVWTYRR